ncbi:nuclear transport factor 2 family protein [Nocardioides humi]|uniref:Mce-associated membrane protein n=1 Tax=Nocardioides humi TaxID=449461 RepID=A0ABN2AVB2_9ACTN|nr:nuclear transport factor 2 family protein [Nocardioides humi]
MTEPGESSTIVVTVVSDDPLPRRARWRRLLGRWTWVVLAVSVIAVVAAYLSWKDADADVDLARAQLRDLAVIEGTAAVETMNSMDYRDVEAGLEAWRSVTTGVLHDQLMAVAADERQLLADQGKIATARVVEAALTDLSDRTATLIAAVEVTVADKEPDQEPTVKRNRYSAELVLVDGGWKLEDLAPVPVTIS